ncbi:MAG: transcription antitermination factor NusB [Planctomycetes bacterium]|nr:transcription antitermination factor NusB [Planctomycetota bacterium]
MRKRTLGRELALKYLFSRDLADRFDMTEFESFARDQEKNQDAIDFARELCEGSIGARGEIIELVEGSTRNWTWRRMPVVDRCLLLLGSFELLHREDIPASVTINEVVDLAKKFSTAASGSFVNGVLDTIRKKSGKTGD